MIMWDEVVFFVILFHTAIKSTNGLPDFNVSFSSKQNETGHWISQVQLGHQQDQAWDMFVDHTVATWNGTNSSIVDARIIAPPVINGSKSSGWKYFAFDQPHQKNAEKNVLLSRILHGKVGYELADGWLGYYKVYKDHRNWFDARQVCENEDAHLLIINSNEEAEAIRKLKEKTGTSDQYYWSGFHNQHQKDVYVTVFNDTLQSTGYVKWGYNEPDMRPGENCGVFGNFIGQIGSSYGLGDAICMKNLPFICEENIVRNQEVYEPPTLMQTHLSYVIQSTLGYYKIHSERKSWEEAEKTCVKEGAHLLIINSLQEEENIMNLLSGDPGYYTTNDKRYWVGVHDRFKEGNFVTVFSDTLQTAGYSNWYSGEPNGNTKENCVWFIYKSKSDHAYHDGECSHEEFFICEQEV